MPFQKVCLFISQNYPGELVFTLLELHDVTCQKHIPKPKFGLYEIWNMLLEQKTLRRAKWEHVTFPFGASELNLAQKDVHKIMI